MIQVSRINLYPIKSLSGCSVSKIDFIPSGGLSDDRRWAICDEKGDVLTAKREPQLHGIRTEFFLDDRSVEFETSAGGESGARFSLSQEQDKIAEWLSDTLGYSVRLIEDPDRGIPDDPERPGPTVIARGTLNEVAGWFPGLDIDEVRNRFRANLEFDADDPFWEDQLAGTDQDPVRFQIGDVSFEGVNICQRCAVPTRNSASGEPIPGFAASFSRLRESSLPPWSRAENFDHFYRLAVNTRVKRPKSTTRICVGDTVTIN